MERNLVNLKQLILSEEALERVKKATSALEKIRDFMGLVNGSGEIIISASLLSNGFLEVILRMETAEGSIMIEKEIPQNYWKFKGEEKESKNG